jgi:hypothetical protein
LSDGVGSATVAVTTSVGDLRDVVTLNAPNIVNDRYITYWLNTPPVLGDKIIFVTADCTVDDSGAVDAPVLATKMTTMIHWILASGITQIYQVAVNNAGIVSGSVKRIFAAEKILAAGIKAVTFNTSTKKV